MIARNAVANSFDNGDDCDCQHLLGAISITEIGDPFEDADPDGSGPGCILEVDAEGLYLSCQ